MAFVPMSKELSKEFAAPWIFWLDVMEHLLSHPTISLAPQRLWQSILPGWIFAHHVTVNAQNSSYPEAEQAILAKESYGRQLGKVMDALEVLIRERNNNFKPTDDRKLQELCDLHKRVTDIKTLVVNPQLAKIVRDLDALRTTQPDTYATLISELPRS